MFKFKFLLWALTKLLQRAVKKNPACAQYIRGKNLEFQIRTRGGAGRHFVIADGKVSSATGLTRAPGFTMTFRDAASGFAILSAKESKEAFLTGLRTEDLSLSGDFVEIMWFQGLTEFLQPGHA
ncbi:helicase [Duganella sp. FT92W]|uniref:Helicase n=1 Tax=Pseudoduganella rivuli TaxID=2666085 RepID=A0A7X2LV60_9BURK|nr:helicase [Pseudoduganella rivuli]MRV73727.1 helicase [Pseudoduganella rivuli]